MIVHLLYKFNFFFLFFQLFKKNGIYILSLLLVLILTSCNLHNKTVKSNQNKTHLTDLTSKKKLIALTGNNAYSYFIYKGKTMGFEYELLQRLSKYLKVDIEIKVIKSIKEMIEQLKTGKGNLIAFNFTVTKKRKKFLDFTKHLNTTKQVLVQRLPKNRKKLSADKINKLLIRDPIDLEGKTVYVRHSSAYLTRLKNLSDEIGSDINIVEADDSLSIEDLILKVAKGEIDYTVSDENIALLNKAYLPNIDIQTHLSFTQKIAWAVNKGDSILLKKLNNWIDSLKKTEDFYVIYDRYYKQRYYYKYRRKSKFFLSAKGKISLYDNIFKECGQKFGYDWRLLAAIGYVESQFKPKAKAWTGAIGIMQLLPETGKHYGATNLLKPKQNICAAVNYIAWLDKFWSKYIYNNKERIKFILASYNIGFGHVLDAYNLTEKYGANKNVWFGNVEYYLLKKSNKKYYNDNVVKNGYCNCIETVNYVKDVLKKFNEYKQFTK